MTWCWHRMVRARPGTARACAAGLASLFAAGAAWAGPPSVTVADFDDYRGSAAASRIRAVFTNALERSQEVAIISFEKVVALAAERGVEPKELGRRALSEVAGLAGADAVVTGRVQKIDKDIRLAVAVIDVGGREVWSKDVVLGRGELSPALAQRFSTAIGAASKAIASQTKPQVSETGWEQIEADTTAPGDRAENDVGPRKFVFSGQVTRVTLFLMFQGMVRVVDEDVRFVFRLKLEKCTPADDAFPLDEEINFGIHSPAELFSSVGMAGPREIEGQRFKFSIERTDAGWSGLRVERLLSKP